MKRASWCYGCGELKHKCYCDMECPYCDKKLKDCIRDSYNGECPNKVRYEKLIAFS
jgi:hypothetical protein